MQHTLRLVNLLSVLLLGLTSSLQAQIGIGTTTPDPSAQLDVVSTSKGVLVPRVSSTASITATSEGLLVYQTMSPIGFYVYQNQTWNRLTTTKDQMPAFFTFSGSYNAVSTGQQTPVLVALGHGGGSLIAKLIDGVINRNDISGRYINLFHQQVPRNGVIRSIRAIFNNTLDGSTPYLPTTMTVQVYASATAMASVFAPLTGATALIPISATTNGNINAGDTFSVVVTDLNIPVTAGACLLVVVSGRADQSLNYTISGDFNVSLELGLNQP